MALVPNEKRPVPDSYSALLGEIKERIRSAQYAALRAVNLELLSLYWDIGRLIVRRQQGQTWERAIVENLANDLRLEFPRRADGSFSCTGHGNSGARVRSAGIPSRTSESFTRSTKT